MGEQTGKRKSLNRAKGKWRPSRALAALDMEAGWADEDPHGEPEDGEDPREREIIV